MQTRRAPRLVAGALVLALPLLGSCGFDKATDQEYTQAAGINDRDGDVDVLSAVIVAAQPDSGTFVASLNNNLPTDDFELTGVAGSGDWSDLTVDPSDLSIAIPGRGFVNLVNEDPITVSGDFEAGQVAELTLTFDSGDSVTMDVPIVFACNAYEGLDTSSRSRRSRSPPRPSRRPVTCPPTTRRRARPRARARATPRRAPRPSPTSASPWARADPRAAHPDPAPPRRERRGTPRTSSPAGST